MTKENAESHGTLPPRVLTLDGGGAKGFYTLGVLREVEAAAGRRLCEVFDLIYGTSTGSIIASLLALGRTVEEVHQLYRSNVPTIMGKRSRRGKTAALAQLGSKIFEDLDFSAFKTGLGIVATNWQIERPFIFKTNVAQAYGRKESFTPGFGCKIRDAVQASCSAYPFFELKRLKTASGDLVTLADGGFCANDPTLYALADATHASGYHHSEIRLLSVGCGVYPTPNKPIFSKSRWINKLPSVQMIQKILEINTQSMEQLVSILYSGANIIRINERFSKPELATDLLEYNMEKLNLLRQHGALSYSHKEDAVKRIIGVR